MKQLMTFLRFFWDFVVGDDWRVAFGVAGAIAATALVSSAGAASWWILPACVAGLLSLSVFRAARR